MTALAGADGGLWREAARLHDYVAAELRRLGVDFDDERLALAIDSAIDAGARPSLLWLERA